MRTFTLAMETEGDSGRLPAGNAGSAPGEESPAQRSMGSQSPQPSVGRSASPESAGAQRKRYRKGLYRGVRERSRGRWTAEVKDTKTGIRKWVGTYPSAEAAALAFDEALRKIRAPLRTRTSPGAYLASTHPLGW